MQQRPQVCGMLLCEIEHADELWVLIPLEDGVGVDLVAAADRNPVSTAAAGLL